MELVAEVEAKVGDAFEGRIPPGLYVSASHPRHPIRIKPPHVPHGMVTGDNGDGIPVAEIPNE